MEFGDPVQVEGASRASGTAHCVHHAPLIAPIVLVVSGADRRLLDQLDSNRIHGIVKKPFDPLDVAEIVSACAEIRGRSAFETMAYATLLTSAPLIALLGSGKLT